MQTETRKKPGRPRSEKVRTAILVATISQLGSIGYEAVTIEGIARQSKTGKATIYRWWPGGKSDLVIDAAIYSLSNTSITGILDALDSLGRLNAIQRGALIAALGNSDAEDALRSAAKVQDAA